MKKKITCGKYMETLRKKKKLSQEKLGAAIGNTRQYIDAIEKEKIQTSPPNFEKLSSIADIIASNEEERKKLLWLGFIRKLGKNLDYYTHFHPEKIKDI